LNKRGDITAAGKAGINVLDAIGAQRALALNRSAVEKG
jgi:hypothetical protein